MTTAAAAADTEEHAPLVSGAAASTPITSLSTSGRSQPVSGWGRTAVAVKHVIRALAMALVVGLAFIGAASVLLGLAVDPRDIDTSDRAASSNITSTVDRSIGLGEAITRNESAAAADFLFLVALEGSGHHFFQSLFERSPADARLRRWRIAPKRVQNLQMALYHNPKKENGLFSAPCAKAEPNGTTVTRWVESRLRGIDAAVRNASASEGAALGPTAVPLNAARIHGFSGMMSYPNFDGPCRSLQYPDLDALYRSCDAANVSCRHIVLTRNPHAVIHSTTMHKHYNPTRSMAMELYATMLNVMFAQVSEHPDRLAACWEYSNVADVDVGALLGWDPDGKAFGKAYRSIFKGGGDNMTEKEKLRIVPPELEVYMSNMERATERVRRACKDLLLSRRNIIPHVVRK